MSWDKEIERIAKEVKESQKDDDKIKSDIEKLKKMDIVVLGMKGGGTKFKPAAYLTCYPKPYQKKELKLYR